MIEGKILEKCAIKVCSGGLCPVQPDLQWPDLPAPSDWGSRIDLLKRGAPVFKAFSIFPETICWQWVKAFLAERVCRHKTRKKSNCATLQTEHCHVWQAGQYLALEWGQQPTDRKSVLPRHLRWRSGTATVVNGGRRGYMESICHLWKHLRRIAPPHLKIALWAPFHAGAPQISYCRPRWPKDSRDKCSCACQHSSPCPAQFCVVPSKGLCPPKNLTTLPWTLLLWLWAAVKWTTCWPACLCCCRKGTHLPCKLLRQIAPPHLQITLLAPFPAWAPQISNCRRRWPRDDRDWRSCACLHGSLIRHNFVLFHHRAFALLKI